MEKSKLITFIKFYFVWVIANIIGVMAGMVIGGIIGLILIGNIGVLSLLMLGATLGISQWLALRTRLDNSKHWVFLTALGSVIGVIPFINLTASEMSKISIYVFGGFFGISLGVAQWFCLRQRVKHASLWILISLISVAISTLVNYNCNCGIDSPVGGILVTGTYAVIYVSVYAVISGLFLTFMTLPQNFMSKDKSLSDISDKASNSNL